MSHFTVGVIVPADVKGDLESVIDDLLAPFWEGLDVPQHSKPCYCVSRDAEQYGSTMANKLVGSWEERKKMFWALPEIITLEAEKNSIVGDRANLNWDEYHRIDDLIDQRWTDFIAAFSQQWDETKHDYTVNHPQYGQPRSDCDTCAGSGTYLSTYNPQSKWDWYSIGGRWNDDLIDGNRAPVAELISRAEQDDVYTFYALVTPEGEWIERGQMGWWGMSSNDKAQDVWQTESLTIYRKFADHDIVLLDCHI